MRLHRLFGQRSLFSTSGTPNIRLSRIIAGIFGVL